MSRSKMWVQSGGDPRVSGYSYGPEKNPRPNMVCSACLLEFFGGEEKTCSHGVLLAGGYVRGDCSKCGREAASSGMA